jgi:hypothetical protein
LKQSRLFDAEPTPETGDALRELREAEELVRQATRNLLEASNSGPGSPLKGAKGWQEHYRELSESEIAGLRSGANLVIRDGFADVPQALFLSWGEARQLDHCMRRDLHAAALADFDDERPGLGRRWFLARARMYSEDLNNLMR